MAESIERTHEVFDRTLGPLASEVAQQTQKATTRKRTTTNSDSTASKSLDKDREDYKQLKELLTHIEYGARRTDVEIYMNYTVKEEDKPLVKRSEAYARVWAMRKLHGKSGTGSAFDKWEERILTQDFEEEESNIDSDF